MMLDQLDMCIQIKEVQMPLYIVYMKNITDTKIYILKEWSLLQAIIR